MELQTTEREIFRSNDALLEYDEETQKTRLKLLGNQRRLLYACTGLPTISTLNSKFKSNLYHFVSNVLVFWFIPHTITQFMALYQHMNDIELLADLVFQLALYIQTGTMAFFFRFTRKELSNYFELLETQFVPNLKEIGLSIEHKQMVKNHIRQGNFIIRILFGHWCWILFSWAILPAFTRYYELYTQFDQFRNESLTMTNASTAITDEYRKYFGILIWLPNNIDQFPVFELFYLFDFVGTYGVSSWCSGQVSIYLVLMHNISMHFKLLIASIDNLDIVILKTLDIHYDPHTTISEFKGESVEDSKFRSDHSASQAGSNRIQNVTKDTTEVPTPKENLTISSSSKQQLDISREHEEMAFNYLVQCIKYHQALLEFCEDVNQYLGPILLLFLLGFEGMVIFSAVRLAMGLSEGNFKFFASVIYVVFWPLVICIVGQDLTNQSENVQFAAYNSRWYNHSTRIKKQFQMMIMRAQKPVKIPVGKFYSVSLETYSDMGNKVYAIFTLLKQLMAE
ncbi:Odorant receptor 11 [Blattella germanica]|nr:Odorant receptor 11 [Blattella germanica]